MFTCPSCYRKYLIGEGWIPPPCIFKSSNTIRVLPEEKNCVFTHIECECGQHIGVQVISGPRKNIGYWRMQFDLEETESENKGDYQVAKAELTREGLKYIFQGELTSHIYKNLDVQLQNKTRTFMLEKMVKKIAKGSRGSSV